MKILCVIDSLGSGGAQRQLVELSKSFKNLGNDVSFLVYHESDFYKMELINNQIPVKIIKVTNWIERFIMIRSYIRNGRFDVVLSFLERPNLICELVGLPFRNWKLIVGERSANPNITNSIKLRLYRFFHFLADYVVANSNKNMELVLKSNPFLSKSKCKVIYNFIDDEIIGQQVELKPKRNSKFRLIVAASHQYLKNLNGLIEGVKNLPEDERIGIIIEWHGDKSPDSSYINGLRLIKKYSLETNFVFYPATKNIFNVMKDADAVGLFSYYEGFPNSICEAMALQKIVICSAVSDLPKFLKDTRNILFDPRDSSSITNSLSKLLKIPHEVVILQGVNNRGIIKKTFTRKNTVGEYLKLFGSK